MDSIKALLTRAFSYVSLQPEESCEKKIDLGVMEICSTPGRESLFGSLFISGASASQELSSITEHDAAMSSRFGAFK